MNNTERGRRLAASRKALNELFSDTSCTPEETASLLEELREEIDTLLDTLPESND